MRAGEHAAAPGRSGIGDDKPDLFSDPKFLALRIRNVRYDMSWDALSVPLAARRGDPLDGRCARRTG